MGDGHEWLGLWPVSLGRPFRAFVCVGFVTQGGALGYLRADLWSLGRLKGLRFKVAFGASRI
jgi:hypothetical protein